MTRCSCLLVRDGQKDKESALLDPTFPPRDADQHPSTPPRGPAVRWWGWQRGSSQHLFFRNAHELDAVTLGAADSFPGEGEVAVLLSSSATKLDVPRAGGLTDCHALDPALGPCVCPANWRRGRVSAPIVRNVVGAVEQEAKPPKDSVVTVPARVFGVVGGQVCHPSFCRSPPPAPFRY